MQNERIFLVVASQGDVTQGDWTVSDGRSLMRFQDGLVVPNKGMFTANRGTILLEAFDQPGGFGGAGEDARMGPPMVSLMNNAGNMQSN